LNRRSTITLNWRPAGAPARRRDDFVEVAFVQPEAVEPPLVDRSDITARLENWGRWARSAGGSGAASMTGSICDSMRNAAGQRATREGDRGPSINANDAASIGRAMTRLTLNQRRLLGLLYIDEHRPGFVAARLGIRLAEFERQQMEAMDAVDVILSSYQSSKRK